MDDPTQKADHEPLQMLALDPPECRDQCGTDGGVVYGHLEKALERIVISGQDGRNGGRKGGLAWRGCLKCFRAERRHGGAGDGNAVNVRVQTLVDTRKDVERRAPRVAEQTTPGVQRGSLLDMLPHDALDNHAVLDPAR